MPYRLTPSEPLAEGLKRILGEQIDKAQRCLDGAAPPGEAGIFRARRCLKKARAALRLARPSIGEAAYRIENRDLRDAGRRLSVARDRHARVETLRSLQAHREVAAHAFDAALLELAGQVAVGQSVEAGESGRRVLALLTQVQRRGQSWTFADDGWTALNPALKRTYSDGHEALGAALRDGDAERMHEWRKLVKQLAYQLRILRPAAPELLGPMADQARALAAVLGRDHDLWLLSQWVGGWEGGARDREVDADLPALIVLVARERAQMHDAARPLARQVYGLKPGAFVERVGHAWESWRG